MTLKWSSATDQLYAVSNSSPSLDLDFASNKSLLDNISGLPLVNHQRDASSGKSAGTYVGSDGLIKTSVVNLLTYSEDFSPSWFAGTATVSAAPSVLSPTGTANTKKLSVGTRYASLSDVTAGNQYTFSIYVRSAGLSTQFALMSQAGFTGDRSTIFNIIDGTLVSSGSGVDNYSITSFPNGWYRVSQTDTAETSGNTTWYIESVNSSAYIWGAQLEENSTASTYVPTTNLPSGAPQYDHDPVTGESLGLLIEEARTNLFTYSEEFDNANWTKIPNASIITANNTTAPDGNPTADLVSRTANQQMVYQLSPGAGTYVFSVYAKAGSSNLVTLASSTSFRGSAVTFNLSNGVPGSVVSYYSGSDVTITLSNPAMTDAGNGWWRCQVSVVHTTGRAVHFEPGDLTNTAASAYFWGAQLESGGSFQTSYIPTSGSVVTRAADVASITGTNFSSWYNSTAGSFYADVKAYGTSKLDLQGSLGRIKLPPLYYNTTADTIKSYGNTVGPTVLALLLLAVIKQEWPTQLVMRLSP